MPTVFHSWATADERERRTVLHMPALRLSERSSDCFGLTTQRAEIYSIRCLTQFAVTSRKFEMNSLKRLLESLGFKRFVLTPTGTCAQIGLLDGQAAWMHTPHDSFGVPVSSILTPESKVCFHKSLENLKLPDPGLHTLLFNPIGTVLFLALRFFMRQQYERQRGMSEFQIALSEYSPNPPYPEFPYDQPLIVERVFQTSARVKDSAGRDWVIPLHVLANVEHVSVQPAANAPLLLEA